MKLLPFFFLLPFALALSAAFLLSPQPVNAQEPPQIAQTLFRDPEIQRDGQPISPSPIPLPNIISRFGANTTLNDIFRFILTMLTLFAGIIAFIFVLYGGFKYVTAGGDESAAAQGRSMIVGAIIGLIIIALANVLVQYLIQVFSQTLRG